MMLVNLDAERLLGAPGEGRPRSPHRAFSPSPASSSWPATNPDGDSVRFMADTPARWNILRNHFCIQPSKLDHSVQPRFHGIDATELHYVGQAQPPEDADRRG
jgi:hypothetical protein